MPQNAKITKDMIVEAETKIVQAKCAEKLIFLPEV